MTDLRSFDQITPNDADAVGGKGLSLGRMASAGLPVPHGFCITTAAHRRLRGQTPAADPTLQADILAAYQKLGGGPVAVRSSATAEDGQAASFAGQQETFLGVRGDAALVDAVGRCWASLDSERAVAYRRKQGVDDATLAMAVVVQKLVPSEVAGVLFTRDPMDAQGQRMMVEASWGLGESVVSGKVTPDRFHVDRQTGQVLERHVRTKASMITADGPVTVPTEKQNQPCLDDARLAELAELGRKVEAFYGDARDIEWAWADGQFWLLQARPITTAGAAEREQVRREEIAALKARAAADGTVWSRFNLAEILPDPTPMSWAVVRRLMAVDGGFGLMYRDLGFDPDPTLGEEGIFDLVCGHPYYNLSREPRMQHRHLPYEHPFAVLKANPALALYPQPHFNPARAGFGFWIRLPWLMVQLTLAGIRLNGLSKTFAETLRTKIVPPFVAEVTKARSEDLSSLSDAQLVDRFQVWVKRTLVDFARDSLKPTALAGVALANLERMLAKPLGAERTRAALGELSMGTRPDAEADLPGAVRELGEGRLERSTFLERFGHRGNHEMELARPRWSEDAAGLPVAAVVQAATTAKAADHNAVWERIATEAKLTGTMRNLAENEWKMLHIYLGLRETAKHYLMMGHAEIRRVLVELDRRYKLAGGIFFLTPDELPRLIKGEDLSATIAQRRRRRTLALSLEVPAVLFSDDLEAIGRPTVVTGADHWNGVPLSAGVAEGEALVLEEPTSTPPTQPYILVCPSTDPAWVPLFVHARGLVMETGGVLSHGAIVAREFGLPAVAGIPDICRTLRSGQRLRIDGGSGVVTVLG